MYIEPLIIIIILFTTMHNVAAFGGQWLQKEMLTWSLTMAMDLTLDLISFRMILIELILVAEKFLLSA